MRKLILLLCALLWPCLAMAGLDEAVAAYNRGDVKTAAMEFQQLAKRGNAHAQFYLGVICYQGQGVSQDFKAAAEWFRKAADQGYPDAQSRLGLSYYKGQGVPQDYVQAHQWLSLAVVSGDKNAIKLRDFVAAKMSADQIKEAQRLAQEWSARNTGRKP